MPQRVLVLLACLALITFHSAADQPDRTYPLVDTGQVRCYNDLHEIAYPRSGSRYAGQDAQYAGNTPSYRTNGDGTVTDRVTGLMWIADPGKKVTYAQAVAGVKTCRVGGYDDWRLPSIKELYSLILFSGIDPDPQADSSAGAVPFIDTKYFKFSYGRAADGDPDSLDSRG